MVLLIMKFTKEPSVSEFEMSPEIEKLQGIFKRAMAQIALEKHKMGCQVTMRLDYVEVRVLRALLPLPTRQCNPSATLALSRADARSRRRR